MAELDTSGGGKHKGGKIRSKKASTRIDLTAMVDLAFLLITFFIMTTTLAKPKAMDMFMPDKSKKDVQLPVPETRTMTVLLGTNNKMEWYIGAPGKSAPTVDNFGKDGIRKTLIEQNKKIEETHQGPDNYMIVLVKPSDKSTYKDFVNMLDEINIAGIKSYGVVDITPVEIDLLKKDGLY
ncbi:ExbD/TolR family protein [Mucilaginibacter ginsenosidivorans]|uniref:Biopolymer transporter ExbD n=1 Tax=Mucilaginibacter ginsenosidivorans TaxID=398053 RepID=A0A5B8UQ99_9SPHI|nr:biopolymer transporter ExbD [Mucilaginibacter ginsenosidivorans]QEC61184.1 biopolymer transporter ExbD [Mucilaginibacter ginsenosidivorans]